jgi:hypothetical protein
VTISMKSAIGACTLTGFLVSGGTYAVRQVIRVNKFVHKVKRNERRIEVLEDIMSKEHPEYWPMIYPKNDDLR